MWEPHLRRRAPHRSLPPCGGGTGRGSRDQARRCHNCTPPSPSLPRKGGGSTLRRSPSLYQRLCARLVCFHLLHRGSIPTTALHRAPMPSSLSEKRPSVIGPCLLCL